MIWVLVMTTCSNLRLMFEWDLSTFEWRSVNCLTYMTQKCKVIMAVRECGQLFAPSLWEVLRG